MRRWPALLAAAFVLLAAEAASGDYILSLVDAQTGATSATRAPGETLALDVRLANDPGDATDSVGFALTFSRPGLTLTDYAWAAPEFETGGPEDFTSPSIDELPATLAAECITFSANTVAFGVTFSSGTLVTIDLAIPASFADGSDTIAISPDLFLDAETFEPVPTAAGPPFMLTIGDGTPPTDDDSEADPDPPVDDDPDAPVDDNDTDADPDPPVADDPDAPVDDGTEPAPDTDDDGVSDDLDAFPDDPAETTDTDGDGTGDGADTDDDGDGLLDAEDPTPSNDGDSPDDGDAPPSSGGGTPRRSGTSFCGAAMLTPFAAMLLTLAAWRRRMDGRT